MSLSTEKYCRVIQLCNELVSVPCALVSVVLVVRIPIRLLLLFHNWRATSCTVAIC